MARRKYTFAIVFAAVLLIGAALYVYFTRYAPIKLDESAEIQIWYADSSSIAESFESYVLRFNSEVGAECQVTATVKAFDTDKDMLETVMKAVKNGGELPDVIMCDPNIAAYLQSKNKLADMEAFKKKWDTNVCEDSIISECTYDGVLVSMPVASETNVLIVNTELFSEADSIDSFEELCNAANKYYAEEKESFFTISDYTAFFNSCMAQLGEQFKAENPFDCEDDNVRYIYDQLATSAFIRGYTAATDNPAAMAARGELACAVVSTSQVMEAEEYIDMNDIVFMPVPCMENGDKVYTREIIGMSIFKSDENTEKGAAIFIKWFTSEEINSEYVGYSGFTHATGNADTEEDTADPVIYAELAETVDSMEFKVSNANPYYAVNCYDFNSIMDNIMKNSLS